MRNMLQTVVVAAVTATIVSGGLLYAGGSSFASAEKSLNLTQKVQSGAAIRFMEDAEIVDVVHQVEPAVVSVIISKDLPVLEQYYESPFGSDSPFFNFQIPRVRQNGTERRDVGGGTAFFISSDGLLMTNKHVVADADADYTVLLNDGRKLPAKVTARDPGSDIALLKVDGTGFPFLTFSADEPKLGQQVIAIGNALGEFRNTVSVGVISGMSRSITAGSEQGQSERLSRLLQTDAAINQGNSGGPLLSMRGEVMGMNTAVAAGAQNIGFAIPAGELAAAQQNFSKNGTIIRPYLGVRYIPVTAELKEKNKLAYDYGALVARGDDPTELAVLPGSPADKAGLLENDIILDVDGVKLDQDHPLADIISSKSPADVVELKVARKGKEITVRVTLEAQKE